jgi:protein-disulfide isomerase
VDRLLDGVPQQGSVLGRPGAPVSVQYYGDLQCPICRDLTLGGFKQLVEGPVRQGKVKVDYRNMQTATHDMNEFARQQTAALAAGEQQKFWNFVELFYHQQGGEGTGYATQDFVNGIAGQIKGLDMAKWLKDAKNPAFIQQLHKDAAAARAIGANSTPTLVFRGPKGVTGTVGDVPYSDIEAAIAKVS